MGNYPLYHSEQLQLVHTSICCRTSSLYALIKEHILTRPLFFVQCVLFLLSLFRLNDCHFNLNMFGSSPPKITQKYFTENESENYPRNYHKTNESHKVTKSLALALALERITTIERHELCNVMC